ncbi:MAG: putative baseplate assembly protein [Rhizobiales bacterium]|nr:putative baseplate assembly protein [Hyphomicrobiales bacterium]
MAKDYESFRQLMLDRLSATLPAWQERHAPDLGIAIVEALAYVADYLSYYQDAAATEAYLGTARQRVSVRRHARLLDYVLHEGCNARAWIHCRVGKNIPLDLAKVMFVALDDRMSKEFSLSAEKDLSALPDASYEIFQPVICDPINLYPGLNEMDVAGELVKGGTSTNIELESLAAGVLKKGAVLVLRGTKTVAGSQSAVRNQAPMHLCHAVALTEDPVITQEPAAKAGNLVARITWHIDDAIPEYMLQLGGMQALGNIVLADHGQGHEDPGSPASDNGLVARDGRAGPLRQKGLTHCAPLPREKRSAASVITQDPRQAVPAIKLKTEEGEWKVRADLLESLPTDQHFCVEVDDKGRASIRFGDGAGVGERPSDGTTFAATYRLGNGQAGNVPADTITRILVRDGCTHADIDKIVVTNPVAATGGIEPESAATARLLAPGDMRVHQHRAISADDYAEFARSVAGVSNATATIAREGARRIVSVAIDPEHWKVPVRSSTPEEAIRWEALKHRVLQRLEPVRRINHEVIVVAPTYVELVVKLTVAVMPSYVASDVAKLVKQKLVGGGSLPEKSFFDDDNLTFGQSVHWSQVASWIHSVPGVASVQQIIFERADAPYLGDVQVATIEIGPHEIAVLSDPDVVDASDTGDS